jgi:hypothetical protein
LLNFCFLVSFIPVTVVRGWVHAGGGEGGEEVAEYGTTYRNFGVKFRNSKYFAGFGQDDGLSIQVFLAGGHFGDVCLGLLTINGSRLPVAVKTPKSLSSERMCQLNETEIVDQLKLQRDSLRDELRIIAQVGSHSNILKFYGAITTSKDDFQIVTEYCENGSLDNFLREKIDSGCFVNELMANIDDQNYQTPSTRRGWKV